MEKTKSWQWTEQCEVAFSSFKGKLLLPPILSFSQFDRTFVMDTDASQEGISAVLAHEGNEQVIAYAYRVLSKAEKQYCATRQEMLALVWAVKCFHPYPWEQGQIARGLEILAEYDFTIQHRPGLKHCQDYPASNVAIKIPSQLRPLQR